MIVFAVAMLVAAGFAIYLMWPATDERADVDAMLPTKADMPGTIPFDGLSGMLSSPSGHKSGRVVLTGDALADQCRTYRHEHDGWACQDLLGLGWVVLLTEDSGYFQLLSTVLAYPDDAAASRAYAGMVADVRHEVDAKAIPGTLADECTSWGLPGATIVAYREGPVVVQAITWDAGVLATEDQRTAMAVKWPRVQLAKIDAVLAGR